MINKIKCDILIIDNRTTLNLGYDIWVLMIERGLSIVLMLLSTCAFINYKLFLSNQLQTAAGYRAWVVPSLKSTNADPGSEWAMLQLQNLMRMGNITSFVNLCI